MLQIKTGNVTYTLPAAEINIDDASGLMDRQVELKDITVSITVMEPAEDMARLVEDTAKKMNIRWVLSPLSIKSIC